MLYKQFVYTPVILIITVLKLAAPNQDPYTQFRGIPGNQSQAFRPNVGTWNGSSEESLRGAFPEEEPVGRSSFVQSFQSEVYQCIEDHQNLVTANVNLGKSVILKCFKTTLMLNLLKNLGESSRSSIKLFNGLLEFEKIPGKVSGACGEGNCEESRNRNFGTFQNKKDEYVRLYKKAMLKLINERRRLNAYRNRTEEEKADQLNKINANSQAFLSEVIKNFGNEEVERAEEEKLKKEMADPRLLSLLDALSKEYMLRFRFYPGVSARVMRSNSGGFSFDVEVEDSEPEAETEEETEAEEEVEAEVSSDEGATREIKDGPQAKDYFDYDYGGDKGGNRLGGKKGRDKNKKKKLKKKAKKLKKILPYLLLPLLIQVSLLPLVLKKLFFLAMKALLAGKVALILVTFNLLRNSCIQNEDEFQKIRVDHYGYGRGEEYGAWINGRAFPEPSVMAALSREPFLGQKPVSQ